MSDDNKIRTGLWKKESNNGGAPYYGGKVEVGGVEYWVNLYKNDRKETDSHPDLNLQLKPVEGQAAPKPQAVHRPAAEFDGEEIPF